MGIPQEILAGSNSSHFQRGKLGSKKKWGDDLTKIPTCGISTVFSDGKKFNWCLSSMGPRGENRWQSTRWCLRWHKDLTELGMAESWNPAGLREGSADLTSPQWSQLHLPGIPSSHSSTASVPRHGDMLLPQHRILSRKTTPTRRGKEGLSSGKAVSPKSCQSLVTSNREEHRRRKHVPAPALLCSPATTRRTLLTSKQGFKGVRLKGVQWEGI